MSQVLIPRSNACLIIGRASASGSVYPIVGPGLPKDMAPRITLDTFRPDFPSLLREENVSFALHKLVIELKRTGRIPF